MFWGTYIHEVMGPALPKPCSINKGYLDMSYKTGFRISTKDRLEDDALDKKENLDFYRCHLDDIENLRNDARGKDYLDPRLFDASIAKSRNAAEVAEREYKSAKDYLSAIDANKDRILTENEVF